MCYIDTITIDNFLNTYGIYRNDLRLFKRIPSSANDISAEFMAKLEKAKTNLNKLEEEKYRNFFIERYKEFKEIYEQK